MKAGVNVNELADGQTPLHYAAETGMPESFNVLMKEIRSLGLNIDLIEDPANAKRK